MATPRKITLVPLIAATYFMVAGGPYGLEDIVARAGYTSAIVILLVTPLIWSLPTALMVSELASALPQAGGFYVWVTRAMGRFWGFQEVWLSLAGSIFDMAIYPTLFVEYLGHFAPALTSGGKGIWIGVGLVAVCAIWNLLGSKAVGRSSVILGVLLLSPFAILAGYALFSRSVPGAVSVPLHRGDLLGGILVAMWNLMGWDNASTIAGDVDRPQRTYPRAMIGTLLLVTLTYVLPIAAVALTGLDPNLWSTGGWAEVARAVFGNSGALREFAGSAVALAITAGGMVGAAGTLNALTMSFSQLPAVMGEDGFLPKVFARRHSRTGAPWVAIIACSTAWALCLGFDFVELIVLDVLLTGLSILLEFAALVVLRIREPDLPRPYRVPGGLPGAIAVGLAPLALLILTVVRNHTEAIGPISALQLAGLLIAAGGLAYVVSERARRRKTV
jgi:amino acid transporter